MPYRKPAEIPRLKHYKHHNPRARCSTGEHRMYIGPDTLMPAASALAAIAGVVLMFWRRLVGFMRVRIAQLGRIFAK